MKPLIRRSASHRVTRFRATAALLGTVAVGCAPLDLGSNVAWSSDLETGNFSDWQVAPGGGAYTLGAPGAVESSTDHARSGTRSAKLTAPANGDEGGAGLWRAMPTTGEAYYSAWFFIPAKVALQSYWTIEQFRSRPAADVPVSGINVNLRPLPDGSLVVYVLQNESQYLAAPLADPTPLVPIGKWFQLEALVRFARDASGRFALWLDGRLVYDLNNRSTAGGDQLYWVACNVTRSASPAPLVIYVDDAATSLDRMTPQGVPALSE